MSNAPPWHIQPARMWHTLGIARMQRLAFGPVDAYDVFTVFDLLTTFGNHNLRAASSTGATIGFVSAELDRRRDAGWIVTVGVVPQWQRRGIGAALLSQAEAQLSLRAPRVCLTVRKSNASALQLYARQGYRQVQLLTRYYRDGEEGLVLEKRLRA